VARLRLIRSAGLTVPHFPRPGPAGPNRDGSAVRSIPFELPLMVVNRDVAVLAEPPAGAAGPPGLLVVRDEHVVRTLAASHDLLWSATQVDTPPATASRLPPYLGAVVAELATGVTDAAAARNLHVSERTVSRRVGEILDRLGATSRFQAGVVAAHSGLVRDLAPASSDPAR
jgi:DNA-binding CsgD family transcriptional regulator